MKKTFKSMAIVGAAATLFAGSSALAADTTRARAQQRDQTCLSTQQSAGQATPQKTQQRLNQGAGQQARTQKQTKGK
jgi:hypothetical protein